VDGAALVSDPGPFSGNAGAVKFGSGGVSNEIETSILPHTTDARNNATAPTTVLPAQRTSTIRALAQPKRRRAAIAIAVIVTAVVAATSAIVVDSYLSKKTPALIQSVAVLPFANQSGNADVEYLSDGITESLINSLSQLPNLSVKGRSTVFHYKGKDVTPQQVGSELSVQGVLNGRFIQRGGQLMLNLELVDARTGNQIWGEQYNRTMADLVSLQSEIARDVSNKLRVKLSNVDERKLTKSYTANPEAYQFYLKGRFYWNQRTEEALKKSIEYFNQAIEKDPSYALAYAGLGDAYSLLPGYGGASPRESFPKAEAAARRAVELDDTLAEAHTSLAQVLIEEWNLPESDREIQRAIALNPNYPTAHHW
jgi:TolB-like protein